MSSSPCLIWLIVLRLLLDSETCNPGHDASKRSCNSLEERYSSNIIIYINPFCLSHVLLLMMMMDACLSVSDLLSSLLLFPSIVPHSLASCLSCEQNKSCETESKKCPVNRKKKNWQQARNSMQVTTELAVVYLSFTNRIFLPHLFLLMILI